MGEKLITSATITDNFFLIFRPKVSRADGISFPLHTKGATVWAGLLQDFSSPHHCRSLPAGRPKA